MGAHGQRSSSSDSESSVIYLTGSSQRCSERHHTAVTVAPVEGSSVALGRFLGCGIAAAAVRSSRRITRRASSPYVARSPLSLAVCTSSRKVVYRSASTCSHRRKKCLTQRIAPNARRHLRIHDRAWVRVSVLPAASPGYRSASMLATMDSTNASISVQPQALLQRLRTSFLPMAGSSYRFKCSLSCRSLSR